MKQILLLFYALYLLQQFFNIRYRVYLVYRKSFKGNKGQTYEGFIEEVSKNPAWEMETVWILYKRK